MHILLSCAKKQHSPESFASAMPANAASLLTHCRQPQFQSEAVVLRQELLPKTPMDLQALMHISSSLAELNCRRIKDFNEEGADIGQAIPALWLFAGDAYQALSACELSDSDCLYLDKHLRIVSGLYGFLRAFDWTQPYRLEMKTRLKNPAGQTLYDYWTQKLTSALIQQPGPVINCASAEYSQAIDRKQCAHWVDVVFTNKNKSGQQAVIGIKAKKARGDMVSWMASHHVLEPNHLKEYNRLGYCFDSAASNHSRYVFAETSKDS